MAINWSLLQQPDIIGNALNAFEQGKEMRRADSGRNAMASLAQNPNDQAAFGQLAQSDPATAIQFRQHQGRAATQAQETKNAQLQQMGRLLNHATDEASYQQALAAAKQIGIPVDGAPPAFDPNWINQQKTILQAFEKDGGQQISGLARELTDAGYKPGTPEFQQAMATALRGKYAPQYTDQQGNLRQSQLPPLPGLPKQQIISQRPEGMSDSDLFAQAREAIQSGANADDVFRQLQAWGVQP
jgi:hypothetical protein